MTGTPAATSDFDLSIVGPKPEKLRVEAYNHLKNKFGINSKEILNDMLDMNIFGESRLAHAYDMLPPTIREEAASEILKFSDELILRRGLKNAQDNGDADTVRIILKYMKGHGFTNHAPLPTISSTNINAASTITFAFLTNSVSSAATTFGTRRAVRCASTALALR